VFLGIALVPDQFGVWMGTPLHLTVQPFTWWRDSLKELGTVVDWKTGARMADDNQHQIVAYALVAIMLGWAKTPEEIETTLAYLVLGEEKSRRMSWEVIERSREKIIKACDAMRENVSVGPDGLQEAVGEEFPQCGVTWKCRNCKFRRVCFPNWSGKAAVSPASDAQRAG
jgi:CRISPR/Cas system-associated exonuclease Cas4 (RecB family)